MATEGRSLTEGNTSEGCNQLWYTRYGYLRPSLLTEGLPSGVPSASCSSAADIAGGQQDPPFVKSRDLPLRKR